MLPFARARLAAPLLLGPLVLVACGGQQEAAGPGAIPVISTDTDCEVARTVAPAGSLSFSVTNNGSQVTEFYLYDAAGQAIIGEVENIGPGLSRDLTVSVEPGAYVTACKPGQTGDGIRAQFDVTSDGAGSTAADDPQLVAASAAYAAWVTAEAAELQRLTGEFAAAVKAGDVAAAQALYPVAREPWERIEPVAESFGDLDPKLDARENDVEPGDRWTGWHRLEKDLWVDGLQSDSAEIADLMVSDTADLVARIATLRLTADRVANGAKELLDEVATGKITGEEDRYSHTDLWDFQANVEGAKQAYDVLAEIVEDRDPGLADTLDAKFAELFGELEGHRVGDGFALYTALSTADVQSLSTRVEALSEPLSRLTAVVLSGVGSR